MKVIETELTDVLILEPRVFGDDRGYLFEAFNLARFQELTGAGVDFVQDNHSSSQQGVLRGIHYQVGQVQGKLVRAVAGEILDVAVDLRRGSPNFGRHIAVRLSAENKHQLWVPPGFGHGFSVLSEQAEVLYKVTDYWSPESERTIAWDDPALAIDWVVKNPIVSSKDAVGKSLLEAELFD